MYKPDEISSAFTVDDIHKIRAQSYEKRKHMTPQEICEDTHKGAERFLALLALSPDPNIQREVANRLQSTRKAVA